MAANDDFTRAIYHLQIWGHWRITNRGSVTRGYPSSSAGISSGGGSEEFNHLVEREDAKAAHICDTIIDELLEMHRLRLESEYIMRGAIKHNRHSTAGLLADAQRAFWAKAKRVLT